MIPDINDTRGIIEHLTDLAETDSEEFDRVSRELVEKTIESFPEAYRKRARGLQFRIDATLSRCKDPLSRMNAMVEIFWDHFQKFHDAFNNPEKVLAEEKQQRTPARVIDLRERASARRS
ncbi:uncharacterized protein DUF3135 [Geothermobacter ehrlichii]|uniref:Uncharacterized protein DUF3135 n=1 Tax=Geothermobacter ehrlichii TaxID=213224 RepID=A0A5D3WJ26_9BACT|nr:DUF3135 domain-containing protein [Geothermobacter ehrlichii]TYO97505.1 uncharacterized protein DUF3135 [Geothermobacter ehrlichii]